MSAQPAGPDADPRSSPRQADARAALARRRRPRCHPRQRRRARRARAGRPRSWPWSRPTATATACCPAPARRVRGGATWLGVAQLGEAMELRAAGLDRAGAVLAARAGQRLRRGDRGRRRPVGLGALGARRGGRRARALGRTARIHLKVDTGLGRNGAFGDDWPDPGRRGAAGWRPRAPSAWSGSGRTSPTPTRPPTPPSGCSRSGSSRRSRRPSGPAAGWRCGTWPTRPPP